MSSLESEILSALKRRNAALCMAESCTGGRIASRLTAIAGASESFWGSFIAYDNSAKLQMAQVPDSTLREHGAVSEETARSLAEGALRQMSQALGSPSAGIRAPRRLAISTTGIAGPTGERPGKPIGLCYVAIADSHGRTAVTRIQAEAGWTREKTQEWFAEQALRIVLARLAESSDTP